MSIDPSKPMIELGRRKKTVKAVPRLKLVVFGGVIVSHAHSRRPRVLRLEPSKARPGSKDIRL